jgi:hypothetical protein
MEVVLLTFVAACWAVLGTGAITSFVAWSSTGGAGKAELDEAWQRYAWSKRFRFRPASGEWPRARSPRIEGRVEDVDVVIEACTITVRGAPRPCTRIWARSPTAYPARVVVSSDPRLVQGPGVHELERVRMDDPFFDHSLSVRASSGEAASRWLSPRVRRDLQALLSTGYKPAVSLQVDGGEVSLIVLGEETRPATLDEACGVVARACASAERSAAYR